MQYHPIDRFRRTDSILDEMFRQDHLVVARESSHLQFSADNNTHTWGALAQCPAALSQPCAISESPKHHLGNTIRSCPAAPSVEQPKRQIFYRHDSGMAIDALHQCSRTFSTSCPMLPPVHSATIGKVPMVQAAENLPAFSNLGGQAASFHVPVSTGCFAASDSMASQTAVVSTEDVLDTDPGEVIGFPSGPLPKTSALSATDTIPATVRSPLESSPNPSDTSAGRYLHVRTSPSEVPTSGDRQASFKSVGVSTRVPHKLVERRYRDKMKAQLDILYSKLPALRSSYPCTLEVEESLGISKGPPKAVVIAGAVKYIEQLESELEESRLFVDRLQKQVAGLQKLVKCDDCSLLRYFESAKTQSAARVSDS